MRRRLGGGKLKFGERVTEFARRFDVVRVVRFPVGSFRFGGGSALLRQAFINPHFSIQMVR